MLALLLFLKAGIINSTSVDLKSCEDSCSKSGECHEVYQDNYSFNDSLKLLYICKCFESFAGKTCQECEFGKYGSDCKPCPQASGLICSGNGVCAMGREGSGQCSCFSGYNADTDCAEELSFMSKWHLEAKFMTCFLLSLVFCVVFMHLTQKFPRHFLPSSLGAVVIGIVLGVLLKYQFPKSEIASSVSFDPQIIFLVILPPIMLEAGMNLQHSALIQNFGTIMIFGVPGMITSALIFAGGLYGLCYFLEIYSFSLIECLLFGTLVSALDPVATLSIFKAMNLDSDLQSIVLGESVFNDAVAITMFKILHSQSNLDLGGISLEFLYVLIGSAVIGVAFGLANTLVFKHSNMKEDSSIELALFILLSYFPFLLCEAFGLSGILCLLFVGMTASLYTLSWMSSASNKAVVEGFSIFSYLSECFCFMYLGICISAKFTEIIIPLVASCILLMLLSRGLVIFVFAACNNRFRAKKILFSHQCIIWVSGMRGAVAFSLALSFPYGNPDAVISTTQCIILFTLFCVSFGIYPILKGLKFVDELEPMIRVSVSSQNIPSFVSQDVNWFEHFHTNYMIKWFKAQVLIQPE